MRGKKRRLWLLAIGLVLFAVWIYLVITLPPTFQLSLDSFQFPVLPVFFAVLFLFLSSLFSFVLNNKRRGILIGLFAAIYLILRLNGLKNLFFLILLLILMGSTELFFLKRK